MKIEDWVTKYAPSKIKQQDYSWIQVTVPNYKFPKEDPNGATNEWNKSLKNLDKSKINSTLVNKIAKNNNLLVGKWMLFLTPQTVDKSWGIIAKSILNGNLSAISAKVSPSSRMHTHLICVYTSDFTNVKDVMKIRQELEDLGFDSKLNYKADIYTHLGLNSNNKWDIPVQMYTK